jgi:hypothetical protein
MKARPAAIGVLALLLCACWASAAQANTPITHFSALPSVTQAGGHPDVEISFAVANRVIQNSTSLCNCEDPKDATVHLPTGFIGDPHAAPECSLAEFSADKCPIDSQVGVVSIFASGGIAFDSVIYTLIPPPEDAGLIGFKLFLFNSPQYTVLSSRTGSDYGLDAKVTSIYHGLFPLQTFQEVLWGVPADPSHDQLRINPQYNPNGVGNTSFIGNLCNSDGTLSTDDPNTVKQLCFLNFASFPATPSNSPLTPYLQNPTTCDTPLQSAFDVLSYDGESTHAEQAWPQMTGCDQLGFNPSLYAQPTATETDTASGIDVNLSIPQQQSPTIPSPTELKAASVTLPAGFSINPNAADGKTSCSDGDAAFGTERAAECPEFSKVGSLEIDSSALPGPLPGFVYLGEPLPEERYRIFLVADGFGTHVKLPGTLTPDQQTGQLRIVFNELPETPLTAFNMHFFGSERGLLATPTQCGTYPVTSTFTPWDSSIGERTSTQFFHVDSGPNGAPCPGSSRPFDPSFEAASAGNTAGAHSPFSLELKRSDGDQNLNAINVTTPPGFSATLAGIPYCPEEALAKAASPSYTGLAEEASPSCSGASQIGTAVTGAGAGSHPLYVPGKVYMSGPYKGAPLSLAVITPAVSGPYDLGNTVVRAALYVDPTDAHISAISDPLPRILQGVPLRLRSIRINLDRQGFTLNPTRCSPFSVTTELFGDQGAVATPSSHFQVANCASLPFAPKLTIGVSGNRKRRGHPALHAALTAGSGESNIARTQVTLPATAQLDNSHLGSACAKSQFLAGNCPADSVLGSARAETPLLSKPLEGTVYLVSGLGHKLPDIVAALRGQIDINLDGKIDAVNQRLRTSFETVPDVPVSKFTLDLLGGKKGLLIDTKSLCKGGGRVTEKLTGQNGAVVSSTPPLQTPCNAKARHKRKGHK